MTNWRCTRWCSLSSAFVLLLVVHFIFRLIQYIMSIFNNIKWKNVVVSWDQIWYCMNKNYISLVCFGFHLHVISSWWVNCNTVIQNEVKPSFVVLSSSLNVCLSYTNWIQESFFDKEISSTSKIIWFYLFFIFFVVAAWEKRMTDLPWATQEKHFQLNRIPAFSVCIT